MVDPPQISKSIELLLRLYHFSPRGEKKRLPEWGERMRRRLTYRYVPVYQHIVGTGTGLIPGAIDPAAGEGRMERRWRRQRRSLAEACRLRSPEMRGPHIFRNNMDVGFAQQAAVGGAAVSMALAHELSSTGLHVTDNTVGDRHRRSATMKRTKIEAFMMKLEKLQASMADGGLESKAKGRRTLFIGHNGMWRRGQKKDAMLREKVHQRGGLNHGPVKSSLETLHPCFTLDPAAVITVCTYCLQKSTRSGHLLKHTISTLVSQ
ncbi:hypothetical protein BHM03_00020989 [Ensete ventricosum]|uniref:Uncharacterized protein n=1 Tax=Ensete ventricosum TaxID=4639 RepID=A0A445MG27_ENSVE|nr:hypothetical protein BHM03_00020989 [Ensete ventricosum]